MPFPDVMGIGEGHGWIGLDYRASGPHGEPSVTWFDTDLGTELVLTPSFQAFLDGLTSEGSGVAG